jgi:hypothetical protein
MVMSWSSISPQQVKKWRELLTNVEQCFRRSEAISEEALSERELPLKFYLYYDI